MKILRLLVGLYAVLGIVGALVLINRSSGTGNGIVAAYLLINAGVVSVGLLFERGRYTPKKTADHREWLPTGERFIDDSTGKAMEVRYHPATGERDYIETGKEN